jgi:hypothetical protein
MLQFSVWHRIYTKHRMYVTLGYTNAEVRAAADESGHKLLVIITVWRERTSLVGIGAMMSWRRSSATMYY